MNNEVQLSTLLNKISRLEAKVADTRYFIETALCLETKKIYLGTLIEQMEELSNLYKIRKQLTSKN